MISGGIAGLVNWTTTYPIDVIHARQIAQHISIKQAIKQFNASFLTVEYINKRNNKVIKRG